MSTFEGYQPIEDIVARIREHKDELRPAERRVAEMILTDLPFATRASNADLARKADVSEPTVTRFCRAIGCDGVRDFKIRLAQSLAAGTLYVHRTVSPDDDLAVLAQKMVKGAADAMDQLLQQLDMEALRRSVEFLVECRQVEIFGVGAGSGIVARDAQLRFARLDMGASAQTDGHLQLIAAACAGPETVVMAISHTGRTRELIHAVKLAKKGGAKTVAITPSGSPLARSCDIVLSIRIPEDTDLYTPSLSRLAHLALVDILSVAVALRRGPRVVENLKRIKLALAGNRLDPHADPDKLFP